MFKTLIQLRKTKKNAKENFCSAQATVEFTFSMVIILLMMYSLVMIFRWAGVGLVERQHAHENTLIQPVREGWWIINEGPISQTDPFFYRSKKMRAVFGE